MSTVPKHIIKEAKRRGIVPGATIQCAHRSGLEVVSPLNEWTSFASHIHSNGPIQACIYAPYYTKEQQWATVIKPAPTKTTMKRATKGGITCRKTARGINVTIAAYNGNKLAPMLGYNTKANMQKGLKALKTILDSAFDPATGKFDVTDLTPKKK